MPSFSFQKKFANKVKRNTKPGTVRDKRKRPMKVGDMMHCFTGMRTKNCQKIVSRKNLAIVNIKILYKPNEDPELIDYPAIELNGVELTYMLAESFAVDDGFKSFIHFIQFFREQYGLPFNGDWYVWKESALKKYGITQ
ncbi:MAG: hypothetical protein HOP30_14720 [Cyclobacteriaceae bacterium]|nr:hypothetical protein [Cyclobacteriaceae bacterium]